MKDYRIVYIRGEPLVIDWSIILQKPRFVRYTTAFESAIAKGVPPADKEQFNRIFFPINGYAPGNYTCTCRSCNKIFHGGDKRAVTCFNCAIKEGYPYSLEGYEVELETKNHPDCGTDAKGCSMECHSVCEKIDNPILVAVITPKEK